MNHRSAELRAAVFTAPAVVGPALGVGYSTGNYGTALLTCLALAPFIFLLLYALGMLARR